jgi:hypothetical protein
VIYVDHTGHVVGKGRQKYTSEFWCGNILEKGDWNPTRSWEDNIKMDLGEV